MITDCRTCNLHLLCVEKTKREINKFGQFVKCHQQLDLSELTVRQAWHSQNAWARSSRVMSRRDEPSGIWAVWGPATIRSQSWVSVVVLYSPTRPRHTATYSHFSGLGTIRWEPEPDKPNFHLDRHASTQHDSNEPMHFGCQACQQHCSTHSTWQARLAQHDECDRSDSQISFLCNLYIVMIW